MTVSTTEGSCSRNLPDGEVNEKEEVRLQGIVQTQLENKEILVLKMLATICPFLQSTL